MPGINNHVINVIYHVSVCFDYCKTSRHLLQSRWVKDSVETGGRFDGTLRWMIRCQQHQGDFRVLRFCAHKGSGGQMVETTIFPNNKFLHTVVCDVTLNGLQ